MSVHAVVLAAGQGTRLRPLTDDRPKCMVELGGVPLIRRQIAALHAAGVADITVVGGYRCDGIVAPGAVIVGNERFASTNMVASLFCADRVLSSGADVLVSYGDIVCEPRVIVAVLARAAALQEGPAITVAVDLGWRPYWTLRFDDPLSDAESLSLRADGSIAEIGRPACSLDEIEGQYIGLLVVPHDLVDTLAAMYQRLCATDAIAADSMFMTELLQQLVEEGHRLVAAPIVHGWLEVDLPSDIELYESGALRSFYRFDPSAERTPTTA